MVVKDYLGYSAELLILLQRNLVPTDEITVYYQAYPEGDYLDTVIKEHTDFIFATIKAALKPYPVPTSELVLIQEKTQVRTNNPLEHIHRPIN